VTRYWLLFLFAFVLFMGSGVALAQQSATCIHQEVSRELSKGQPSIAGTQRICFTKTAVRNETTYDKYTTVAIFDVNEGEIYLIPSNEHQYVQMHLVDYRKLVKVRLGALGFGDPSQKPSLVKTDKVKTIRSWTCRLYTFTQKGKIPSNGELWVTQDSGVDFKEWFELMEKMGLLSAMGDLGKIAANLDGLPISVRVEQIVFGQHLVTSTEVTSIDREPADGLFVVPHGYKKMDVKSIDGSFE